jgi:hypothetical protein
MHETYLLRLEPRCVKSCMIDRRKFAGKTRELLEGPCFAGKPLVLPVLFFDGGMWCVDIVEGFFLRI